MNKLTLTCPFLMNKLFVRASQIWRPSALLLPTIHDLINLVIGGTALMGAVPGLAMALNYLPTTDLVRSRLAVLAGQKWRLVSPRGGGDAARSRPHLLFQFPPSAFAGLMLPQLSRR